MTTRDLVDVERLRHVLVGPGLHRRDRDPLGAVRGEEDDGERFVALADRLQELYAVHVRHRVIGHHGIRPVDLRQGLGCRTRGDAVVPALFRQLVQCEEHRGLVVNQKQARQGSSFPG